MSDRDDERNEERAGARDRHDAMISAGMDGELEREDRERLDELLATTFASIRARLEIDRSERAETSVLEELSSTAMERRRRWGLSSAFAAAAALVVYLVLPATKPVTEEPLSLAEGKIRVADGVDGAETLSEGLEMDEEELALALGYGDETSEISAISNDDLDVIERLDLLDFLSAREMEERG